MYDIISDFYEIFLKIFLLAAKKAVYACVFLYFVFIMEICVSLLWILVTCIRILAIGFPKFLQKGRVIVS